MKIKMVLILFTLVPLGIPTLSLAAETAKKPGQAPFTFQASDTIKNILLKNMGKNVEVVLNSEKSLSGTVQKVGSYVVQLKGLKGREFFDALVQLDKISAVVVRVK